MSVRLRPNEGFRRMIEEVTVPSAVTELDLTGCALLYPQRLIPQISRYQGLRRLRCVASTVNVSDVLTLLLKQLPHLLEIEFSSCTSSRLPRLSFVHVHYRSVEAGGRNWRMTWMRRAADHPEGDYALSENGPCFQCCSTATYIGLAKPLNRDFEPFL
ncbi:hypothetical protein HPB52_020109 [Rhipicephalus sanguineus]|uniref:Uncharacterized protein n=1 Tax=Rhipicephalus sanguineus TaxID=34632 RepID=A0A9D4PGB6_RHISA|nr:hypothetical protein HPB52_020109 [Rhipicephalus sanguineus]